MKDQLLYFFHNFSINSTILKHDGKVANPGMELLQITWLSENKNHETNKYTVLYAVNH